MRFRADVNGTVPGLRFYKGATNTGTHVGHLWSNTGTLLSSATFTNETASGWQQVTFSAVEITANTNYVASYHTDVGNYAVNNSYFTTARDTASLYVPADATGSRKGVYVYGASAFPTQTYQASNYWVDVVFTSGTSSGDTTAPTVSVSAPTSGATVSGATVTVSANASDNVGVAGVQFKLDGANLGAEDTSSPYTTTWNSTGASNGTHTLTAVARDAAGNTATSAAVTVTVNNANQTTTTIWAASATPSRIETGDDSAVEVGVRFRADANGTVSGLRFYKGASNTGTHVGSLWSNSGTLLACRRSPARQPPAGSR